MTGHLYNFFFEDLWEVVNTGGGVPVFEGELAIISTPCSHLTYDAYATKNWLQTFSNKFFLKPNSTMLFSFYLRVLNNLDS